ncbi:NAD(P)H-hydrate dehydratase [Psychrobacter sp. FDAARGOS_221]|nr:NAD(P)H-hydrate dehydratase [Psychrobacter sp. FDAARGOS_221]
MHSPTTLLGNGSNSRQSQYLPVSKPAQPLFIPKQVYQIEASWFDQGNPSFGLMQQAAWQMADWIYHNLQPQRVQSNNAPHTQASNAVSDQISVWIGSGNNGGDGWLVACYLSQLGVSVHVVEVAQVKSADAVSAKYQAIKQGVNVSQFSDIKHSPSALSTPIIVDALFGIGLDRAPQGVYAEAIAIINRLKAHNSEYHQVVSIDVPSGLACHTGQVFDGCAVSADITLCLVARKLGLHIKDGPDYSGQVVDLPLIASVLEMTPTAYLLQSAYSLNARAYNSHKGSFGHALIIGGNQVDGSQGMGGAALLAASSALAAGVGKLTVACHSAFHSSLITKVPNAMSVDLHHEQAVTSLISQCDTVAIGMGLGRDQQSAHLFEHYLQAVLDSKADLIIDADGLYHLASLVDTQPQVLEQLKAHASQRQVWYTPHSGEAARLLGTSSEQIESDRLAAINELGQRYQGCWLLKGVGSLVLDQAPAQVRTQGTGQQQLYVCAAGNPGMATAGMGDVLSGLALGLLAQSDLSYQQRSLQQAVMIHALAGDLGRQQVGEWALQANDMAQLIGEVLKQLTVN